MDIGNIKIGLDQPMVLMAGPCVLESYELNFSVAQTLKQIAEAHGVNFIFKSSFEKANRSAVSSFTGLPFAEALATLERIKTELAVPIVTDVHEVSHVEQVAQVADVLQIPALLCRQTKLVQAAVATGRAVNIKKGQFMAPSEMMGVVGKAKAVDPNARIMLCERGTFFGYHNLVSDMRSLVVMRESGCPVIYDVGHSVQLPGPARAFLVGNHNLFQV